jgi:hypothetical protein
VSRDGRPNSQPNQGRALATENAYPAMRKSFSATGRESRQSVLRASAPVGPTQIATIPEGVEVKYGDPNKTKLPVFGKYRYIIYIWFMYVCVYNLEFNL